MMDTAFGDLDVFAVEERRGAPPTHEQLRERAIRLELGDLVLLAAHPEDLIRMKTAAAEFRGRPEAKRHQDREDIAVLERLREAQLKRRAAGRQPAAHGSASFALPRLRSRGPIA
jgi:hypothetical protein